MILSNKRKLRFKRRILIIILPAITVSFFIIILFTGVSIQTGNYKKEILSADKILFNFYQIIDSKYKRSEYGLYKIIEDENQYSLPAEGVVFILDSRNKILYDNNNEKKNPILNILENTHILDIISDQNYNNKVNFAGIKSRLYQLKYQKINYYIYYIDQKMLTKTQNQFKVLYFYPGSLITSASFSIITPLLIIFFITIVSLFILVHLFGDGIAHYLNTLNYAVKKIGSGNLDLNINSDSVDEIGVLYKNLNKLITTYIKKLSSIKKSSHDIIGYENKIEEYIQKVNHSEKNQLATIKNNLNKYEELNNSMMKISINIEEAMGIIEQAEKYSHGTVTVINSMVNEMNKISDMAEEINVTLDIINGISERTRLLSVNSAIEASRAGDVGKGFGVVASEIKKLATQSKDTTDKISQLLNDSDKIIKTSIVHISEAFDVINNTESSIKMISDIIQQINTISKNKINDYDYIKNLNNNLIHQTGEDIKNIAILDKLKTLIFRELKSMIKITDEFTIVSEQKEVINDESYSFLSRKDNLSPEQRENKGLNNKTEGTKGNVIRTMKIYDPKKKKLKIFQKK